MHDRVPGAGCGKPDFFIQKKPLFEVHLDTGMLYNTDGGTPMVRRPLCATQCSTAQSALVKASTAMEPVHWDALSPLALAPLTAPWAVYSSKSKQKSRVACPEEPSAAGDVCAGANA